MIGQAQGDKERIRCRSGAEDRRQHDVAQKSGDARDERQAADGHDAFEHGVLPLAVAVGWAKAHSAGPGTRTGGPAPLPTPSNLAVLTAWAKSRQASAAFRRPRQATLPTLRAQPIYRTTARRTAAMMRS